MHATALTLGALAALGGASAAAVGGAPAGGVDSGFVAKRAPSPFGVRSSPAGASLKLPLYKRQLHANADGSRTPEQVLAHAKAQKDYILNKWGGAFATREEKQRRRSTRKQDESDEDFQKRQIVGLTDVGPDTYYFAQVSFGTPAQNLAIVLDTGSADLWVAATDCTTSNCQGLAKFNEAASSTYQNSSQPFVVQYGQGAVQGHMAADTVSLAGYTVYSQSFGVATDLADNTISAPASGLMGLGFQELSAAGVTPFWEVLAKQSKLQTSAFTFQLARNLDVQSATQQSPGGVFTLGEIDSNQYSGSINYVDIPSQIQAYGYWAIPLQSIQLNNGSPVQLGQIAAIDTGTTLIAVPMQVASSLYSAISGAQPVSQLGEGYYAYPCSSTVKLTFTFGGQGYEVSAQDFSAGAVDTQGQYCLGSVFGIDTGNSAPPYIVGDSFLKNVFSVYRASPPSVGFASLKNGDTAQTASTTGGLVTATGSPSSGGSGSAASTGLPQQYTRVPQQQATGTQIYWASGVSSPSAAGSNVGSNPALGSGSNGGSGGSTSAAAPATGVAAFVVTLVGAAAAALLL